MEKDRTSNEPPSDASPYYNTVAHYGNVDGESEAFSITEILGLLRRRWEIIAIIAVIGTASAAAYGYSRPLIFSTTATLMIEPENKIVELDSVVDGVGSDAIAIETQINFLKSQGFLEGFIQSRQNEGVSEQQLTSAFEQLKMPSNEAATNVLASATHRYQHSAPEIRAKAEDLSVNSVAQGLNVTQQGRSYLINISFSSASPNEAAAIANDLAQHYILEQTVRRRQITHDASRMLADRLSALKQELIDAENAVELYRQSNLMPDSGNFDVTSEQIADLISLVVEARADRMEKEARLAYIQQLKSSGDSLESLTEVIQSPYMASLWDADSELRSQSAELKLELGNNHPKIRSIESERQEIRELINWEVSRIIANTQNELDVLVAREESLSDDINRMTNSNNQAGIQLRILEDDVLASRRIYEDFLVRFKETNQQEAVIQANTRLIAEAQIPSLPSNRSPLSYVLLGFLGSSAIGFGLAYVRDKTDRSLRGAKEVSKELGVSCLGLIPYMSKRELKGNSFHEYLSSNPVSSYAESIRTIHTKLSLMEPDSAPQTIQVTSSLPEEGKTTFAVSLAAMLAIDGKRTILLDLDLRNPSVGREITLDHCVSADSFLRGDERFDPSLVQHDKKTGCYILGVKSAVTDPAKLLRSVALKNLIEALRVEYEQIIIDGPPSLGLSDSKALLTHADATLFVVHWNKTSIENAVDSISELQKCNAPIAGAILTQVDVRKQIRYGYHGLDSYYGKHKNYYKN